MWFFTLICLISFSWISACLGDDQVFIQDERYNRGDYGHFPHQTFFSREGIESPRPNFMKPFTNCDDGSYLFVSLRGNVADAKPYMLDATGSLVWTVDHRIGEVYNLQVQEYQGKPYITYWAGDDTVGGHGAGRYYMLDEHYEVFKEFGAANGLDADLHDFRITENNTALITIYEIIEADLSRFNSSLVHGEIWDSIFQEIDIESGEAIFQWRASEHVYWEEAYLDIIEQADGDKGRPWDFYHINTVDKDPSGNYIVSGRYTRSVMYVDGTSGEILWRLGGKNNSFIDLSGGAATTFAGQHDAHWSDSYNAITFFDNRADWFNQIDDKSAGARIAIDTSVSPPTAELVQTYIHPSGILSTSQGSMQTLPNGNVLLGYGFNGVVTEFSPTGTALCDAFFEALTYIGSGDVQSYRAFKNHWTGYPNTPPDLVLRNGVFYVSWLGATEVREWELRSGFAGEGEDDGVWTPFARFDKDGFESHYPLSTNERVQRLVRAYAFAADGTELGHSFDLDVTSDDTMWYVHGPLAGELSASQQQAEEEAAETGDEYVHEGTAGGGYTGGTLVALLGLCLGLVVVGLLVYLPVSRRERQEAAVARAGKRSFVDEERAAFLRPQPGEEDYDDSSDDEGAKGSKAH